MNDEDRTSTVSEEKGLGKMNNEDRTQTVSEEQGLAANKLQLPIARIRNIMKSSPDLNSVSAESYYLITQATELFVRYLAAQTHQTAQDIDATNKMVEYRALAKLVSKDECLDFLEEIVPFKIKMSEYWKKYPKEVKNEVNGLKVNGSSNHMKSPEPVTKSNTNIKPKASPLTPKSIDNNTKLNDTTCNVSDVICID